MKKHLIKAITGTDSKEIHDELLKSAKTWPLRDRFDSFDLLKKYLSTKEIADLLFGDYDRLADCDECNLEHSENREEITEIAIKENRVCDFIFFVYNDFSFNIYGELIPYIKSLVDRGASEKDLLELILLEINIRIFKEGIVEKLTEYGLDLNLISDEVIYSISEDWGFYKIMRWSPNGIGKVIESLSEENQKKLFAKIDSKDVERLFFDVDSSEAKKRLSRFYLANAPKIEGSMPLLYMEAIPVEELTSQKHSNDFKEYLKGVISSKDESSREGKNSAERAKYLLAFFE